MEDKLENWSMTNNTNDDNYIDYEIYNNNKIYNNEEIIKRARKSGICNMCSEKIGSTENIFIINKCLLFIHEVERCMNEIFNELGGGFRESVYQTALGNDLRKLGYNVKKEVNINVFYKEEEVGTVRLDMLVENMFIIEFKAIEKITKKEKNQLMRYMNVMNKEKIKLGILINVSIDKYEICKCSI